MAFFPKIGPFYDPDKEQEIYTDSEGRLKTRFHPRNSEILPAPSQKISKNESRKFDRSDRSVRKKYHHQHQNEEEFHNHDYVNYSTRLNGNFNGRQEDNHKQEDSFNGSHISNSSFTNNVYHIHNPSPVVSRSKPVFSIGDSEVSVGDRNRSNSDLLHDLDDPLTAHYDRHSNHPRLHEDYIPEENNNVFNQKFRGSDHSSCSFGSEQNVTPRKIDKKPERNKSVLLTPRIIDKKRIETSGLALCEQLFGIVLCQYNNKPVPNNTTPKRSPALRERKVIVQDVVHGSPADLTNNIHRGDMLISVNDIQLSWMNLGSVFRALSHHMEAKITFKSPVIIGTPPHPSKTGSHLYRRLTNTSVKEGERSVSDYMYGVLYLTLDDVLGEQGNDLGDVIYQYPSHTTTIIPSIRGVFLTLAHSLVDVTGFTAKSSSFVINGEFINVSYLVHNRNVLVFYSPANKISLYCLNCFCGEVGQLLSFLFCDIKSAFKQSEFHKLDQLFALTFRRLLTSDLSLGSGVNSSRYFDNETGMRLLQLSEENRVICDEILSEFEALDFDEFLPDEEIEKRRKYLTLGSILFYKNWLLTSHVSQLIQSEINLYLKHHALYHIMASRSLDNLVIWEEIYPSTYCSQSMTSLPGYSAPRGRWFLLIVGMGTYLLCTILEAGGVSREVEGQPTADVFYIDQLKQAIEQLDEDDANILAYCEERINENSISLTGVDRFLPKTKSREDTTSPQKVPASPKISSSPVKSKFNSHYDRQSTTSDDRGSENADTSFSTRQGSKLSYGSNDSTGSDVSGGLQRAGAVSKINRFSSMVEISGISKSVSVLHLDRDLDVNGTDRKLTKGKTNVLFNYIHIDDTDGVIITPTNQQLAVHQNLMMSQILNSMYQCCSNIRKSFQQSQQLNQASKQRKKPVFKTEDALTEVQEIGVLFQVSAASSPVPSISSSSRKQAAPIHHLTYWVVGRRLQDEEVSKDLFVCFHESIPQSSIEMAFTLGFGS